MSRMEKRAKKLSPEMAFFLADTKKFLSINYMDDVPTINVQRKQNVTDKDICFSLAQKK